MTHVGVVIHQRAWGSWIIQPIHATHLSLYNDKYVYTHNLQQKAALQHIREMLSLEIILFSHLLTDNIIQVRNADVRFHERDLIHLLRKRPLLDVVPDAHVVVGRWTALRDKHLLWKEVWSLGIPEDGNSTARDFLIRSRSFRLNRNWMSHPEQGWWSYYTFQAYFSRNR